MGIVNKNCNSHPSTLTYTQLIDIVHRFWLSQGSVVTLIREVGDVHTLHVPFIYKSNSEKCIKIR